MEAKILFVDDEPDAVLLVKQTFRHKIKEKLYEFDFAYNGVEALEQIHNNGDYDVILSDINMPNMDGLTLLSKLREMSPLFETVIISAYGDMQKIRTAMNRGAYDFLTKPLDMKDFELTLAKTIEHVKRNKKNEEEKQRLMRELDDTQKDIIINMSEVIEGRSRETGNHVIRVGEYSRILGAGMGMDEKEALNLKFAACMHDVGKIAIPDSILKKPGKLTNDEFDLMKSHTSAGHTIVSRFRNSHLPIVKMASVIALEHHEKFNGKGYPEGKSGKDISLFGRITAIADVFDALGSDRVYKKAWDLDSILDLIKEEAGQHFDPVLVKVFFDHQDEILDIREKYKDEWSN